MNSDFRKYATSHLGINPNTLSDYANFVNRQAPAITSAAPTADYMNPYIL